ncbi:MAG: hypothetical protein ABI595_06380 [Actinomycetota bacterium]
MYDEELLDMDRIVSEEAASTEQHVPRELIVQFRKELDEWYRLQDMASEIGLAEEDAEQKLAVTMDSIRESLGEPVQQRVSVSDGEALTLADRFGF